MSEKLCCFCKHLDTDNEGSDSMGQLDVRGLRTSDAMTKPFNHERITP